MINNNYCQLFKVALNRSKTLTYIKTFVLIKILLIIGLGIVNKYFVGNPFYVNKTKGLLFCKLVLLFILQSLFLFFQILIKDDMAY